MNSFDLVSDFHTEMNRGHMLGGVRIGHYDWAAEKQSNILVIAGDLANTIANAIDVLREAIEHYDMIIFTDGNHEHYQRKAFVSDNMVTLEQFCRTSGKSLIFLGNQKFLLKKGNTAFVGCNGWYDFNFGTGTPVEQRNVWLHFSNDPKCILFHSPPEELALLQANRLAAVVAELQDDDAIETSVVITHTAPVKEGLSLDDEKYFLNQLNGAYGNSKMTKVISADFHNKIKVWVFGHTHYKKDFIQNGIRFLSNPRGYHNENRDGLLFKGIEKVEI